MYIIMDEPPKTCFECPVRSKCSVWERFLLLPTDIGEVKLEHLEYFKPEHNFFCLLNLVPKKQEKFYRKWVKGECRHLCLFCKYRKECDI